ncbi:MAG: cobyric acid synthase [Chloroflexota bacterium]
MAAPVLMVQGTASSVGKSVIAAGLCRILRRRGWRVAPFKAQNMSLNAAVTLDGGEIARSTAVQAAAAGLEATVDMNPILLKPEAGMRAQVIVRGKAMGTVDWSGDRTRRPDLWPTVVESLDRLRRHYDVIVAEGAGSPAEMNLRASDIANMRVARHADATVLLVGDIDRGGVFAQLLGTLDLLPANERSLVRGLIVNRFRGDPALFADGVRFLEARAGVPVLGVVPYVPDLGLAEEDAATLDDVRRRSRVATTPVATRIVVIRLPHLSNFDDFGPLERQDGIMLKYVSRPDDLDAADLVILPGSKSTISDLGFLRERGLADAIVDARARGTPVIGICGGFQMLGRSIDDPRHVESPIDRVDGLGLLPHETTFEDEKQTDRVRARLIGTAGPFASAHGAQIDGYEIHAGRTTCLDGTDVSTPIRVCVRSGRSVDEPDGALSADGLVFGTYLHGLFDNELARDALLAWLKARRDRGGGEAADAARPGPTRAPRADPYERCADALEAALDVPAILAFLGSAAAKVEGR